MTHEHLHRLWGASEAGQRSFKWLTMVLAGLVLGMITPYDSYSLPSPLLRYGYWLGCVFFGLIASKPIANILLPRLAAKDISPFYAFFLYCCAVAIPVYLLVMMLDFMIFSIFISGQPLFAVATLANFMEQTPNYPNSAIIGFFVWYLQVLVLVFLIFGAMTLLHEKHDQARIVPEPVKKMVPGQVFLDRLPPYMGRHISCLAMEDHYIRVFAGNESCLILMRMADAALELTGYGGMQVHRSWWVAFNEVKYRDREGRRHFLVLKDGRKVPVSKTYLPAVKEQGL